MDFATCYALRRNIASIIKIGFDFLHFIWWGWYSRKDMITKYFCVFRLAASLDKIVETLENELELKKTFGRLGKTHKFRKVDAKNFEVSCWFVLFYFFEGGGLKISLCVLFPHSIPLEKGLVFQLVSHHRGTGEPTFKSKFNEFSKLESPTSE